MARKIEEVELKDARAIIEQLPYEDAEDLLPEIAELVGGVFNRIAPMVADGSLKGEDDVIKLLPMLGGLASQLGGGKLRRLAGKILKTTTVTAMGDSGEKEKFDLVDKERRAALFESRPDLYFPLLWHAGRTTFGRFFPAGALRKKGASAVKAE